MTAYDAIVIGTGQAGPYVTSRLAGAGMNVAVIERNAFAGTCVNTGCIPTKTMVASAYAARMAARAAEYGVDVGSVRVDMKRVMARKDAVSKASCTGLEDWLRNMENCIVYQGHARFESAHPSDRLRTRADDAVRTPTDGLATHSRKRRRVVFPEPRVPMTTRRVRFPSRNQPMSPRPEPRSELFFPRSQATRSPWRAAIRVSSADHQIHDLPRHVDEFAHRLPGQARRDPIRGQRRRARLRLGGVEG